MLAGIFLVNSGIPLLIYVYDTAKTLLFNILQKEIMIIFAKRSGGIYGYDNGNKKYQDGRYGRFDGYR